MPAFTFEIKEKQIYGKKYLWDSIKRFIQTLPDGKYIWNHPEKEKKARSSQQNRYYWGCVCKTISKDTGYTPDEIHQLMQKQFLKYENKGEWFVKSTTKLNTKDMEDYLENVRRFASMELSCYVPLPNESQNFFYDLDQMSRGKK